MVSVLSLAIADIKMGKVHVIAAISKLVWEYIYS